VPRRDGLVWHCTDFQSDGTHPSTSGRELVADSLLAFLKRDVSQ
jgi:lysophospholipase L1-like esterase